MVRMRKWWDKLVEKGPLYGYHPDPSKSILLVKPQYHTDAIEVFADTGVAICCDGF